MRELFYWILDNLGTAIVVVLLLFAALTALGAWLAATATVQLCRLQPGRMRLAIGLLLVASTLAGLWVAGSLAVEALPVLRVQTEMVGAPAPPLRFAAVGDDRPWELSGLRGRVVLVNFWATWCPPCRHEMPDLDRLQETYGESGLVVLNLSDESRQVLADYLEESPMSTLHGYSEDLQWPVFGRPTSYVVDRDGVLRCFLNGSRSYAAFARQVEPHL